MPISELQAISRRHWIHLLVEQTGTFAENSAAASRYLKEEIAGDGLECLLGHLRLCGTIPEQLRQNSSEEKAYSKYSDAVVSEALVALGLNSSVIDSRADVADVIADSLDPVFTLVADAKAFRLTRTAKNAKDFKVPSMERWKQERDYAVVVCPIDHMPTSNSQIYLEAAKHNVGLISFSHLAAIVQYAADRPTAGPFILQTVLSVTADMPQSKSATAYWSAIRAALIAIDEVGMGKVLDEERTENAAALEFLRLEGLEFIESERVRIEKLSHQEALALLQNLTKQREIALRAFKANRLLD